MAHTGIPALVGGVTRTRPGVFIGYGALRPLSGAFVVAVYQGPEQLTDEMRRNWGSRVKYEFAEWRSLWQAVVDAPAELQQHSDVPEDSNLGAKLRVSVHKMMPDLFFDSPLLVALFNKTWYEK
eukprot:5185088-Amphidinium_carterae.4